MMFRRTLFLLFIVAGMLGPIGARAAEFAGTQPNEIAIRPLFSIRRSTNRNEIVYAARSTAEGFDLRRPISVYWIMKEEDGRIESLTALEESWAYGVDVRQVTDREIRFSLAALPEREVSVIRKDKEIVATMRILGEESAITGIFIQARSGGILPSVDYIEVSGKSRATGQALSERFGEKKT